MTRSELKSDKLVLTDCKVNTREKHRGGDWAEDMDHAPVIGRRKIGGWSVDRVWTGS
jgi:hypothetical protein